MSLIQNRTEIEFGMSWLNHPHGLVIITRPISKITLYPSIWYSIASNGDVYKQTDNKFWTLFEKNKKSNVK